MGIATSRSSPYNPQGNGQVERYNGIIWKTMNLAAKSKHVKHQKRFILFDHFYIYTSINTTPHERIFEHP